MENYILPNTIVSPLSEDSKLTDKTIGVGATYREVGETCSKTCPALNKYCYALRNYVGMIQRRSDVRNDSLLKVASAGVKFLRLNVSGDMERKDKLNRSYLDKAYFNTIVRFAKEFSGIQIWAYTHSWLKFIKAKIKPRQMPKNLKLLASCDSLAESKAAQKAGWRTARVIDDWSESVRGEVRCPNQINKKIKCVSCGLCWHPSGKIKGVAFLRH